MDYKHGGNIYEIKRANGKDVVDFSANINPLLGDDFIKEVLNTSIKDVRNYPDPDYIELKELIARTHNIDKSKITLGNGAIELIFDIPRILKPKTALLHSPTFVEYERSLISQGVDITYLEMNRDSFEYDLYDIDKASHNIDIVFICNPNNPTSSLLRKKQIKFLLQNHPSTYFVIDEAFSEFLEDESNYTCVEYIDEFKNLIILKSITKFFSIPGLRLGYMISNYTKVFDDNKYVWNINCVAENFAKRILLDDSFVKETKTYYDLERKRFLERLNKLKNISIYSSKANYVFFMCKIDIDLKKKLLDRGILIRDCSNYRNLENGYYRVAIKSTEHNDRLIKELFDILGGQHDN